METISIGSHRLNTDCEPQLSPNGRLLRLSGISLVTDKEAIWIGNMYLHGTLYTFRFLDKDEFIGFEYCPKGKFIKKHDNL